MVRRLRRDNDDLFDYPAAEPAAEPAESECFVRSAARRRGYLLVLRAPQCRRVSTGAYRAVNYIKEHIKLDTNKAASIEDSKSVVRICTIYAQKGMLNIFIVIFSFTIAFACFDASMFASYLISIAIFGLFQALYMANAGGAWDNAKKVVEVDLHEKGTPLP